jgi:glyoxylase-like metal-dependent hydrolase (beta-lactamase superfamily II)
MEPRRMTEQIPLSPEASALEPALDAARNDRTHQIAPDVAYRRLGIVNVVFVGAPEAGDRRWVLIDAGLPGTKGLIKSAAAERFGSNARPAAIIMTHGHFDHVGALADLAREWDVPVYAHPRELPYLDGRASYPPGDPSVGGGLMAALARFYPRGPVDVGGRLQPLPEDGTVPGMAGWRWLHTPGHSVGHFSLWRAADRVLIAGDAFVTTGLRHRGAARGDTRAPDVLHGRMGQSRHFGRAARRARARGRGHGSRRAAAWPGNARCAAPPRDRLRYHRHTCRRQVREHAGTGGGRQRLL